METINKKTHLLDIAEELFCQYGFKETTVRLITNQAGINTAMLNYYFGSKENLFFMVLEHRIKKLKKAKKVAPIEGRGIIEQLTAYTSSYVDLIANHLPFYRLMIKEKLLNENKDTIRLIDAYFRSNIKTLRAIIDRGVLQKKIQVKDLDTFLMSASGVLLYAIFKSDLDQFALDPENTRDLKEHMSRMLLGCIVEYSAETYLTTSSNS